MDIASDPLPYRRLMRLVAIFHLSFSILWILCLVLILFFAGIGGDSSVEKIGKDLPPFLGEHLSVTSLFCVAPVVAVLLALDFALAFRLFQATDPTHHPMEAFKKTKVWRYYLTFLYILYLVIYVALIFSGSNRIPLIYHLLTNYVFILVVNLSRCYELQLVKVCRSFASNT